MMIILRSAILACDTLLLWLMLYQLLPYFVCRLDSHLATIRMVRSGKDRKGKRGLRSYRIFPDVWLERLASWLRRAGYRSETAVKKYLLMVILPVPLAILLGALAGFKGSLMIWPGFLVISAVNNRISRRIRQRRRSFLNSLYKIYRFLDLQISAGIKVTDALRGLPEAARDRLVMPCLVRFAARYELTLDLDQAMDEIRQAFPGTDCEMLATHLRQCLQTGQAGRSLIRMEELLFSRYFNQLQEDTRRIRTQLLRAAILAISPGILFFLYPLLWQAMQAMQSVFGQT